MSILMKCPVCDKKLKAPFSSTGKSVKCPKCSHGFFVPPSQQEADLPEDVIQEFQYDESSRKHKPRGKFDSQSIKVQNDNDDKIAEAKFCFECGQQIRSKAEICPKCGVRQPDGELRIDQLSKTRDKIKVPLL
jgi:uncharacterized paraquat-inducible protein A